MNNQSRKYYRQFYRLTAIAAILMTAVVCGSLMLGDSVRGTLTDRVNERLGGTETVITSGQGFLDAGIMRTSLLKDAKGYLLTDGFISDAGKLIPVFVWGTDNDTIEYGEAVINRPLAGKLSVGDSDRLWEGALHLPSRSLVPSGSLFVTKSYSTQIRLTVKGIREKEDGGNLMLRNDQALPLNIFVSRQQLAEAMETGDKVNIILSGRRISGEDFENVWQPHHSGIHITDSTLTSERIFIQQDIVSRIKPHTVYFSYLVNDIILGSDTVPYTFVTAVNRWNGTNLGADGIILSDYAANRLNAATGDTVRMSYFTGKDMKALETREKKLAVRAIVPLADIMRDSLLTAEFPGLSNVERCTDWDSDLPIKMDRIHKQDEDYWYKYRQTPKAIVSYETVIGDWGNSFGTATALRFSSSRDSIRLQSGCTVVHPRESAIFLAEHGTDFSSLFLALGFFIILSAILLMHNSMLEMYLRRSKEIELYRQIGFTLRHVRTMLFREALPTLLAASAIGVIPGVAYSATVLWLLGNVWSGATHTEGFALHTSLITVITGWVASTVICLLLLAYNIRRLGNTTGSKV